MFTLRSSSNHILIKCRGPVNKKKTSHLRSIYIYRGPLSATAGANQTRHWFLVGKGLGIQLGWGACAQRHAPRACLGTKKGGRHREHDPTYWIFKFSWNFVCFKKKNSIFVGSVGKQSGSDPLPTLCIALLAHCLPLHFPTILPHNTGGELDSIKGTWRCWGG